MSLMGNHHENHEGPHPPINKLGLTNLDLFISENARKCPPPVQKAASLAKITNRCPGLHVPKDRRAVSFFRASNRVGGPKHVHKLTQVQELRE